MARFEIDWTQAACSGADKDVFFDDDAVDEARRICLGCPVRLACLQRAIAEDEEFGVWGGLAPAERQYVGGRRVPKSKLVVVACTDCDEPVTFRLSPVPLVETAPVSGRFRVAGETLIVDRRDLRLPVRRDEVRCLSGHVVGRVDGSTMLADVELGRTWVRSLRSTARAARVA